MKNLKFQLAGTLLLAMLLSISVNTNAQLRNRNCFGNGQGNGYGYYCSNIQDLTTEQQNKIVKFKILNLKEMQNLRNELLEKKAHLQTLRSAEKADINSINKTIDEIGIIQTSINKKREQHVQDVRSLLTDEQKVVFDNKGQGKGYGNGYCKGNGNGRGNRNGCCGRGW